MQQRFVSDVSHELRTPLTTVRMAADVLHEARPQLDAGARRGRPSCCRTSSTGSRACSASCSRSAGSTPASPCSSPRWSTAATSSARVVGEPRAAGRAGRDPSSSCNAARRALPRRGRPAAHRADPAQPGRQRDRARRAAARSRSRWAPTTDTVAFTVRDHGVGLRPGRGGLGVQPVLAGRPGPDPDDRRHRPRPGDRAGGHPPARRLAAGVGATRDRVAVPAHAAACRRRAWWSPRRCRWCPVARDRRPRRAGSPVGLPADGCSRPPRARRPSVDGRDPREPPCVGPHPSDARWLGRAAGAGSSALVTGCAGIPTDGPIVAALPRSRHEGSDRPDRGRAATARAPRRPTSSTASSTRCRVRARVPDRRAVPHAGGQGRLGPHPTIEVYDRGDAPRPTPSRASCGCSTTAPRGSTRRPVRRLRRTSEPQQYALRLEQDEDGAVADRQPAERPADLVARPQPAPTRPFTHVLPGPGGARCSSPTRSGCPAAEQQIASLLAQAVVDGPTDLARPAAASLNPFPTAPWSTARRSSGPVVTVALSGAAIDATDAAARRLMVAQLTATMSQLPGRRAGRPHDRRTRSSTSRTSPPSSTRWPASARRRCTCSPTPTRSSPVDPTATVGLHRRSPGRSGRGELAGPLARGVAGPHRGGHRRASRAPRCCARRSPTTACPVLVYEGKDVAPPSYDRYGNLWLVDRRGDGSSEVKLVQPDGVGARRRRAGPRRRAQVSRPTDRTGRRPGRGRHRGRRRRAPARPRHPRRRAGVRPHRRRSRSRTTVLRRRVGRADRPARRRHATGRAVARRTASTSTAPPSPPGRVTGITAVAAYAARPVVRPHRRGQRAAPDLGAATGTRWHGGRQVRSTYPG